MCLSWTRRVVIFFRTYSFVLVVPWFLNFVVLDHSLASCCSFIVFCFVLYFYMIKRLKETDCIGMQKGHWPGLTLCNTTSNKGLRLQLIAIMLTQKVQPAAVLYVTKVQKTCVQIEDDFRGWFWLHTIRLSMFTQESFPNPYDNFHSLNCSVFICIHHLQSWGPTGPAKSNFLFWQAALASWHSHHQE